MLLCPCRWGPVSDVQLSVDASAPDRQAALVQFEARDAAKTAEVAAHNLEVDGCSLIVTSLAAIIRQKKKEAKAAIGRSLTVFLKNLPTQGTARDLEAVLRRHFADCGAIQRVRLQKERQSQQPRGTGFLDFEEKDAVLRALQLDGTCLPGHTERIGVVRDEPPEKRTSQWAGGESAPARRGRPPGSGRGSGKPSGRPRGSGRGRGRGGLAMVPRSVRTAPSPAIANGHAEPDGHSATASSDALFDSRDDSPPPQRAPVPAEATPILSNADFRFFLQQSGP